MTDNSIILIAGGDMRQIYAAKELAHQYSVYIYGFDNLKANEENMTFITDLYDLPQKISCLILPLPVSNDGIFLNVKASGKKIPISSFNNFLRPDGIILGGRFMQSIKDLLNGYEIIDYSKREEFSVLNAVPTAEAAVKIALENTEVGLYNSKILITGFGRIAKVLAKILSGFGAEITIAARKDSDLCWAEIYGYNCTHISDLEKNCQNYNFIFNTVPALIIERNIIESLNPEVLIIDLASKPGGTDFECAKKNNIKAFHSLSLPGIHFPTTAGKIIAQTSLNIIKERSNQA